MVANTVSKSLPRDYSDLASVTRNGAKPAVNVVGVVVDSMSPTRTKGTDMQMTIRIRDLSCGNNGIRVKFFYRSVDQFPQILGLGDILLLRNLKITTFGQEVIGLSSFQTSFIVFPQSDVVSPAVGLDYAAAGKFINHKPSPGANKLDIHEQQWVIALNESINGNGSETSFKTPHTTPGQSNSSLPTSSPNTENLNSKSIQQAPGRDKFSLIQDIDAGEREGNRSGKFYDLAGEVVKVYFNQTGLGILDLYITDYTFNSKLVDRKVNEPGQAEQTRWQGPAGKMTLHIEVHPPHSIWAQQNIAQGEFVLVKNVRIKWNQRGLGTELEGNLWPDLRYPDKVDISSLHPKHQHYINLVERKRAHTEAASLKPNTESNRSKKKKRIAKEKALREAKRQKLLEDSSPEEPSAAPDTDLPKVKKTNPNITCEFVEQDLSTLETILDNPRRHVILPSGETLEYPFAESKYHAQLRVVDFFPHKLEEFAVQEQEPARPNATIWKWRFWLTLAEDEDVTSDTPTIDVVVTGEDGENLVQMSPNDLKRHPQKLKQLEDTLFLLWGELGERKARFLQAHPHIKPDRAFNTIKYNLVPSNRTFDLCIMEYGVLNKTPASANSKKTEDPFKKWKRVLEIFGTQIKRS